MRSDGDVAAVWALASQGVQRREIVARTGIPYATVRGWLSGTQRLGPAPSGCPRCEPQLFTVDDSAYAYLLGLYLGDGCLSEQHRKVFKLRIVLDQRYPGIIDECEAAIRRVSRRAVQRVRGSGCFEICASWKHWPCLFPQHGPGVKHLRPIRLDDWQRWIVDRHPDRLLRGLIHSDGCRVEQTVYGKYRYSRYFFDNRSDDIRRIFCDACDAYGVAWRQSNKWTISVARREAVARLDEVIGPKT